MGEHNQKLRESNNEDSDSESDSDVSMSSDSDQEISDTEEIQENENSEEEDEVVKAIIQAKEKKRDHPPTIICEDHIVDISFHPDQNILAAASITGDVLLYKYTNEENTLVDTLELHLKAVRDIEFDANGETLFSTSKDKSIILTDFGTGKLKKCIENSHEAPVYCLRVIDEHLISTGDDDGVIKLWDIREKCEKSLFVVRKNEDYISDIVTNEEKKFLVCSSGDGSLTTIDLTNRQVKMQSEEYDEDLTCLGLFCSEKKLLAGSSKGKLFLYNWGEFGLHSDEYPGPKHAINDLIPITENIVVTACEDGILRASHLFPHRHLGIVGQHKLSIECLDICKDGTFVASSSHDNDIKFWNIKYFENVDVGKKSNKHTKKQNLRNNLPSSKQKNAADFFSGLQ